MVYLVILLYSLFCVFNYRYGRKESGNKINYILLCIILICLSGCRYMVGGDTYRYMQTFLSLVVNGGLYGVQMAEKWQPFAILIFALCKLLNFDFFVIQFVYATFINVVFFIFFRKYSKYPFLCAFIYLIIFFPKLNFEIMRESMAIGFFVIGLNYIYEKKYFKYAFCCLLGYLCHQSALFMVIFPFLIKLKINIRIILIISSICLVLSLFSNQLIGNLLSNGYANYASYNSTIFGKIGIILKSIIFPYFVWRYCKGIKLNNNILNSLKAFPLVGCLQLFFFIFFRFENYCMIFMIIALAQIAHVLFVKSSKYLYPSVHNLKPILLSLFGLIIYLNPYIKDVTDMVGYKARFYDRWYPYYTIFNESEVDSRREYLLQSF